jgi:hypothetical protein
VTAAVGNLNHGGPDVSDLLVDAHDARLKEPDPVKKFPEMTEDFDLLYSSPLF